jgi:hypothetical protein
LTFVLHRIKRLPVFLVNRLPHAKPQQNSFVFMTHVQGSYDHWMRQSESARKLNEEKVYQVTKPGLEPGDPDMIIAQTSKKSAARLIAAFAEQGEQGYRVSVFLHAYLPGFQRPEVPAWYPARLAERQREIEHRCRSTIVRL